MKYQTCSFCTITESKFIFKNEFAFVINDKYPVSPGHLLIIPFRHYENYFDSTPDEVKAINELLFQSQKHVSDKFSPSGFNVWINIGRKAGQSIMHAHLHLIPKY